MAMEETYQYIIVGAGLAGGKAVDGIRTRDAEGSILLIGAEPYIPYDRPPLTKKLWFGKKSVEQIFLHPEKGYRERSVTLKLETCVDTLDADRKLLVDTGGQQYRYEKLLLATGGLPRRLDIPGADLPGIIYYRFLEDYLTVAPEAQPGTSVVVIGGGFIGSEIAAALQMHGVQVTMVFPDERLVSRVFPADLGQAITEEYRKRGITILDGDVPIGFDTRNGRLVTHTRNVHTIESDLVIVGIGITPSLELARLAGLNTGNGIIVNDCLQTSNPDIYAAGDVCFFPYQALGQSMRVEHWDNAVTQGEHAGRNMAGADEPYTYMPYFYSDLFDFGYEAVGEVNTRLDTVCDWVDAYHTGAIYYLKDERVRGVMLCNIWGRLDEARTIIRQGNRLTAAQLRGAIRPQQAA